MRYHVITNLGLGLEAVIIKPKLVPCEQTFISKYILG